MFSGVQQFQVAVQWLRTYKAHQRSLAPQQGPPALIKEESMQKDQVVHLKTRHSGIVFPMDVLFPSFHLLPLFLSISVVFLPSVTPPVR
jgi:hypothetical protein